LRPPKKVRGDLVWHLISFGTFTTGQFDELVDFSKIQEQDILDRVVWLKRQLILNGIFTTDYDENNNPMGFFCDPPFSYGAKLMHAYRILGGVPERDMLLRTSDQPVFLTRGVNIDSESSTSGYSDTFSNGRRYRGNQRFDRDIGLKVQKLKAWQLEIIKRKREHLEFKIKRCLDYSDQLQNEITLLSRMVGDSADRSADFQIAEIQGDMFAPGAMNVVVSSDKYGKDIGRVGDKTSSSDLSTEQAENYRGLNDGGSVAK
jgi:hypothetical protein